MIAIAPDAASRGLDRVPLALQEPAQWLCWRRVDRGGRTTKCPVDARTGRAASATDPETWCGFGDAVAAWRADPSIAGVGFVFTAEDPFTGVDLDGCIGDDGELVPGAREVVASLDSYTEVSPSGRGVKVFLAGQKPEGARSRSKRIEGYKETEVYSAKRFFTVTGRHLPGTPSAVEDRQPQLDALCERLWPPASRPSRGRATARGPLGDDEVVEKARSARNGGQFDDLWRGDTSAHGGDESAADLALCNRLAFWTGRDAAQMDRLFRRSGLCRAKWDERRGEATYGRMTIEKAIAGCHETYSPEDPTATRGRQGTDGAGGPPGLGEPDLATGRLVLSPRRTLPTAQAYVDAFHSHRDGRTIHSHRGLLLEWRDNRYRELEEESVRHRLQPWLHEALRPSVDQRTGEVRLLDFDSNPSTVKAALDSIRSLVHIPESTEFPGWLGGDRGMPPAAELLACRSMSVHLPTGRVLAPTPRLLTMNALEFDHDPEAGPPSRWLEFLGQVLGDDDEGRAAIQEWFGYCLVPDTRQQKILLLVGPRRSGKGTIGRILTQLVGPGNVAAPTTGSLAGPFGLQPLLGKSLAVISDARFGGDGLGTVVERLLSISGEDTITVDRKFLGSVHLKLSTRFVILTNELPRLNDASTALAGRFLVVGTKVSFYGNEDIHLASRLAAELPGILNWAIDGWKRLRARGRFTNPASSADAIRALEDLASPVAAFVRERCEVGTGRRVAVDALFLAWQAWCDAEGRAHRATKQTFGRDLAAALPGVERRRGTDQAGFYEGISLRDGVR